MKVYETCDDFTKNTLPILKYKTRPVVDSRTNEPTPNKEPYAKWLHEELEKLREQIRKGIAARDEAYETPLCVPSKPH